MRRTMVAAVLSVMLVLAMAPMAFASGKTAEGAAEQGSACSNAGPDNWTHCVDAQDIGGARVFAMVFSEDGSRHFGDEVPRRTDKYAGQPYPGEQSRHGQARRARTLTAITWVTTSGATTSIPAEADPAISPGEIAPLSAPSGRGAAARRHPGGSAERPAIPPSVGCGCVPRRTGAQAEAW